MGEHLRQLKGSLRAALRAERLARSSEEVGGASRAVCAALLELSPVRHARHLAVYVAAPGEIDPSDAVARRGLAEILLESRKDLPAAAEHYEYLWQTQPDSTVALGAVPSWVNRLAL